MLVVIVGRIAVVEVVEATAEVVDGTDATVTVRTFWTQTWVFDFLTIGGASSRDLTAGGVGAGMLKAAPEGAPIMTGVGMTAEDELMGAWAAPIRTGASMATGAGSSIDESSPSVPRLDRRDPPSPLSSIAPLMCACLRP